jgi:hypothetical protein
VQAQHGFLISVIREMQYKLALHYALVGKLFDSLPLYLEGQCNLGRRGKELFDPGMLNDLVRPRINAGQAGRVSLLQNLKAEGVEPI